MLLSRIYLVSAFKRGGLMNLPVEVTARRSRRGGAYYYYCVIELFNLPSFVWFLICREEQPFLFLYSAVIVGMMS